MGARRAVVLSGGPTHDFPATTARLTSLLAGQDLAAEVHTDVDAGLRALPGAALLVVNALRWTMTCPGTPDRYRSRAAELGVSPAPAARAAFDAHLAAGGGLLAMHTASICFDDWPVWAEALGGAWRWGRSSHPPPGPLAVEVTAPEHPLVAGLGGFTIEDERYSGLAVAADVRPLLACAGEPLLWAREHGGGRVVYDALGHDPASYEVPEHRAVVQRAIRWTAGEGTAA
jgi:uncharacterized protein